MLSLLMHKGILLYSSLLWSGLVSLSLLFTPLVSSPLVLFPNCCSFPLLCRFLSITWLPVGISCCRFCFLLPVGSSLSAGSVPGCYPVNVIMFLGGFLGCFMADPWPFISPNLIGFGWRWNGCLASFFCL